MGRIRIVEDNQGSFGRRARVVFDEANIVDIEELKDDSVSVKLSHQKNEVVLKVSASADEYRSAIDQLQAIIAPPPPLPPPTIHQPATLDSILGVGVSLERVVATPQSRATSKQTGNT